MNSLSAFVLGTIIATSSVAFDAKASGCGGPELYIDDTKVLKTLPFTQAVTSYTMTIEAGAGGEVRYASLGLKSELMSQPHYPNFYYHDLTNVNPVPKNTEFKDFEQALQTATVDLVEDKFSFNCGWPVDKDTENNIRLRMQYRGLSLEFRTPYEPAANY